MIPSMIYYRKMNHLRVFVSPAPSHGIERDFNYEWIIKWNYNFSGALLDTATDTDSEVWGVVGGESIISGYLSMCLVCISVL